MKISYSYYKKYILLAKDYIIFEQTSAPMISNYSPTRKKVNTLHMSGMLIVFMPIMFEDLTHQNCKLDGCFYLGGLNRNQKNWKEQTLIAASYQLKDQNKLNLNQSPRKSKANTILQ